jgi:hypothetical protein
MQPSATSLSLGAQFWEAISPTIIGAVQVVVPVLASTAVLILTRRGLRWGAKALPGDANQDTNLTIDLVRRAQANHPTITVAVPHPPPTPVPPAPGGAQNDTEPPTKRSVG